MSIYTYIQYSSRGATITKRPFVCCREVFKGRFTIYYFVYALTSIYITWLSLIHTQSIRFCRFCCNTCIIIIIIKPTWLVNTSTILLSCRCRFFLKCLYNACGVCARLKLWYLLYSICLRARNLKGQKYEYHDDAHNPWYSQSQTNWTSQY